MTRTEWSISMENTICSTNIIRHQRLGVECIGGHAISKDLVHWEHRPIALSPDDHGPIYSGSVVVDWEDSSGYFNGEAGLFAIFTQGELCPNTQRPRQRQSLAYSTDKGRTWIKYEGNPVLIEEQFTDFRDPKVFWHEPDKQWVMVIAVGNVVMIYTSLNLKEWSFSSEFGAYDGSHVGVWECPDLIELPVEGQSGQTKWVMIVSIGDNPELAEGSRTQYFVGDFDGKTFINDASPETILWLDHGRDNYAGVTWSDITSPDKGKLFIGWMSNWKYAGNTPTVSWRSAMTLRAGTSGIKLVQNPVAELQLLRSEKQQWNKVEINSKQNLLANLNGDVYEIECEIDVLGAEEVGFKLRKSEKDETIVGYNTTEKILFIDRTLSGDSSFHNAFPCKHGVHVDLPKDRLKLRIFVDQSSVEVFANDGEIAITNQIFPDPSSIGLELYVKGGQAKVVSLALYPLKSIYAAVT